MAGPCWCFDKGFVLIAKLKITKIQYVLHYSQQGRLTHQFEVEKPNAIQFGMLRSDELIILQPSSKVRIVSLRNLNSSNTILPKTEYFVSLYDLMMFPQKDIFCIVSRNDQKEKRRIIITYFKYKGCNQQSQHINSFSHTFQQGAIINVNRLNNLSKIGILTLNTSCNLTCHYLAQRLTQYHFSYNLKKKFYSFIDSTFANLRTRNNSFCLITIIDHHEDQIPTITKLTKMPTRTRLNCDQ